MANLDDKFQSVSATKSPNGLLTVTITVLPGDYPGESITIGSKKLTLKSYSKPANSVVETYTYSNSESILNLKVNASVVYKTVPDYFVELDNYALVPRSKFSPAKNPETLFKVRVGDEYACNGWTCADILEDLQNSTGVKIYAPSITNYDIDQFSIGRGTPITSAIKALFQIPYMTVRQESENEIVVDFPDDDLDEPDTDGVCKIASKSDVKFPEITFVGAGHYGKPTTICTKEPEEVKYSDDFLNSEISFIYNSFGDVAGIKSSKITIENFIKKSRLGKSLQI